MITDRKLVLKPILESQDGIHLTIYLVNRGDIVDLKTQLRESLREAYEWLFSVQTVDERKKFLEPLDALLHDARILKSMKGNIGIFRNKDSFRILNVPVDVRRQCHVASSFHVKPLLLWMQVDRDFLILGLDGSAAHLYYGSQHSIQKVDSILFPGERSFKSSDGDYESLKLARRAELRREETFEWLNDWLEQITKRASPKLFLAGEPDMTNSLRRQLSYKNLASVSLAASFSEIRLGEVFSRVRSILRAEARKTLEQALLEFHFAEELSLAKKNIFQIAKAAVEGRIRKLIVAEGINVFGKVDKKTGGVAIHPFDLDHEDDDILDDIAQTVLASGGEVVVAPKEDIPKSRPILAILEHKGSGLPVSKDLKDFEMLKNRMAL